MSQTLQALRRHWIELDIDGSPMACYVAKPQDEARAYPAVIVLMEIFGVNNYIRSVTDRLAAQGYVAIAPNYYHRTTGNLELGYTEADITLGRQHKAQTTREGLLVDIRAVLQWLRESEVVSPHERIGCVGFCFGGHVAYIAAGCNEIAATASFYGAGIATASPGGGVPTVTHTPEIKGEVLCLFGERDASIPHEDTVTVERALASAGVRHEVVRYSNVGHGFFCDQRGDYDAAAADDAWHRLLALFERNLSP
jgi:carboxymethylenebutenolidase